MKYLLGIALGLVLLLAPVAKADGIFPNRVEEIVPVPGGQIELEAEALNAFPQGVMWVAVCIAEPPELQHVDCISDDPVDVFVPIGGSIYQEVHAAFFIGTPEPSTGGLLLVAACFLCAFVALRRRMA
jgi:hypothetical protein